MEICRYLAMTRLEMENFALSEGFYPAFLAWEANFRDLPDKLPLECLLILTDRNPLQEPDSLLEAVEKSRCTGVLLDFETPGQEALVKTLVGSLPCPTAVFEPYAAATTGPVFLPPCPPDKALKDHLAPWKHREIWLDVAPSVLELTLTATGCTAASLPWKPVPPEAFTDEALCCRYRSEILPDKAVFTLWRDRQMLEKHIRQAESLGVTRIIGLFQEWQILR